MIFNAKVLILYAYIRTRWFLRAVWKAVVDPTFPQRTAATVIWRSIKAGYTPDLMYNMATIAYEGESILERVREDRASGFYKHLQDGRL